MFNWASTRKKPAPAPAQRSGPAAERFEASLLASVVAGGRADFEVLYRLYHPRLSRFLAHLVQQPDALDAVLNDTMMVVWQRAAEFDDRSKLSTWIYGIAYRKAMLALGRQDLPVAGGVRDAPADPAPSAAQPSGLDALRARLRCALDELSLEHRTVVELCFFHDMAYAEIAQVMGCPPETVKTRMFHARRRLRLLLDDLNDQALGASR
jgi:RNA polymerase sigma-70 factor (ECF subfamily)